MSARRAGHRRRSRGRAAGALLAVAFALAAGSASAERGGAKEASGRAWRTLKRVPGVVDSTARSVIRDIQREIDAQRQRDEAARPALPPPPDPAEAERQEEPLGEPIRGETREAAPAIAPISESEAEQAPALEAPALEAPVPEPPIELVMPAPRAARAGALRQPSTWLVLAALAIAALAIAVVWIARRRRRPVAASEPAIAATGGATDAAGNQARPDTVPHAALATVPEAVTQPTRPRPPAGDPVEVEAAVDEAIAADAQDREPSPFPGGGRYEILGEIGRGGMGVVFRARDKRLDRVVALKRLPESLRDHPRAVALLLREARSAARLNHPNIVTVYDVDHEDGAYFLTMELLEGQPLAALLRKRGRFAPAPALWLARQAAAGLAYAHRQRVVHRDVKTANLFVTRGRVVKIMDFGLAKVIEAVRRRATRIGGTPDYMAPEQSQGLEVDGRTDLYALGATLFELLTGVVPFEEGDPIRHHLETPPPDPRERVPERPEALAALVLQLLAKRPDERPASADEVAARLRAIEQALAAGAAAG